MSSDKPIRIDKLIGRLTILVVAVFAVIIFLDFKKKPETNEVKETSAATGTEVTIPETTAAVKAERTEEKLNKAYKVCLDAGNGGTDLGYKSGTVQTKDINLELVQSVKNYLEDSGAKVTLTRNDDTALTKEQRVEACNKVSADIMVSFSMTSSSDKNKSGATAYVHNKLPKEDNKLAESITAKLKKLINDEDASVKPGTDDGEDGNFYINNHCLCPSTVVYYGYVSNSEDYEQYTADREKAAAAIADGIVAYLNSLEN